MANYKETNIAGTKYTRAWRVEIENSLDLPKHITFHEQEAVVLEDGSSVTTNVGRLRADYNDTTKTESFDILDPATGSVTGSMTKEELYAALYSLYISTAAARDSEEPTDVEE